MSVKLRLFPTVPAGILAVRWAMKSYSAWIAAAVLCVSPVGAQNLLEHAAAAAGATIGVGTGKLLSNGIDKILDKAASTGSNNTTKQPTTVRLPTPPGTNPPPALNNGPSVSQGPDNTPSAPASRPRGRSRRGTAPIDPDKPVFASDAPSYTPVPAAIYVPRAPSPEDFAKVKEGSTREDVKVALGTPASHMIIPDDDGHLVEILTYADLNRRVGSVRLDNGVVVSVNR